MHKTYEIILTMLGTKYIYCIYILNTKYMSRMYINTKYNHKYSGILTLHVFRKETTNNNNLERYIKDKLIE